MNRRGRWLGAVSRRAGAVVRAWALIGAVLALAPRCSAESLSKPALLKIQFEQKLNAQVPLGLAFTNEAGERVLLRDYFGDRPVILVLGYYGCPMLCGLVLNGVVEALQAMRATAGQDFDVLFVSIDPRETPALAAAKKRTYLKRYGRAGAGAGWHFLAGAGPASKALADAVGFQYAYDSSRQQYAHPSGIVVLTPDGRVAKYFFGVGYRAGDLNAALKEAAARRVGSPVRQLLILCFQHMPLVGKNSATIMGAVRSLAVLTIIGLGVFVTVSVRRERRRRSHQSGVEPEKVTS